MRKLTKQERFVLRLCPNLSMLGSAAELDRLREIGSITEDLWTELACAPQGSHRKLLRKTCHEATDQLFREIERVMRFAPQAVGFEEPKRVT